jgi:hypothetical protein
MFILQIWHLPHLWPGILMHVLVMLTCYLAAALALLGAGFIGMSVLTGPFESATSQPERPKLVRRVDRSAGEQQTTDGMRSGQDFRYGPEVNHGRGDTPVHYSQQALREAKSAAPSDTQQPTYQRSFQPYRGRHVDIAVRPSGH